MNDEATVDEVHVGPAKGEQLAQAQARVSRDAVQLAVLVVLSRTRRQLRIVVGQSRDLAVSASLGGAGDRLDLLGLVEVEYGRRRLASFGRGRRGIERESVCVLAHAIAVDRADHLAVLVDGPRGGAGLVEATEVLRYIPRRDRVHGPVPERGHQQPGRATRTAPVRLAGLGEQPAVVPQRRGLRALLVLEVLHPLGARAPGTSRRAGAAHRRRPRAGSARRRGRGPVRACAPRPGPRSARLRRRARGAGANRRRRRVRPMRGPAHGSPDGRRGTTSRTSVGRSRAGERTVETSAGGRSRHHCTERPRHRATIGQPLPRATVSGNHLAQKRGETLGFVLPIVSKYGN